jgi:hypothetical protein
MAIFYGKRKFADRIPKIDFTAALAVASLDIRGRSAILVKPLLAGRGPLQKSTARSD